MTTNRNPLKDAGTKKQGRLSTLLPLAFLLSSPIHSQTVSVGQQTPAWTSTQVINYKDTIINATDFSGKYIILDFWNQGCLSCIQAFPHIDSMQKQFGDRLQIILVNAESKDSTLRFFKKHPKIKMPSTPLITGGENIWMLFTKSKIPYQLWMDANGAVRYRTGPYNLTSKHLEAFLQNQKLNLLNTEENNPVNNNSLPVDVDYHSFLMHCSTRNNFGHTSGAVVDESNTITMSSDCVSILDLYLKAYGEYGKHNFTVPSQIVLQLGDNTPYIFPVDENDIDQWKQQYSYSYQLKLPATKKDLRYKYMQQDLERYFGLKARIEKRKLPCMVLVKKGSLDKLKTKHAKTMSTLIGRKYENDSLRLVQNYPFKNFSENLKGLVEYNKKIPFIDKTACTFNIDLELRSSAVNPFNLQQLRKDLHPYNLDLIYSEAWVEVLVLTKNNTKNKKRE